MSRPSVAQWCAKGPGHKGSKRVMRGGSWINDARNARSAQRNANEPGNRNQNLGLRLARARGWAGVPAFDPTAILSGMAALDRAPTCRRKVTGAAVLVGGAEPRARARRHPLSRCDS